jgi:hypothetical protein
MPLAVREIAPIPQQMDNQVTHRAHLPLREAAAKQVGAARFDAEAGNGDDGFPLKDRQIVANIRSGRKCSEIVIT